MRRRNRVIITLLCLVAGLFGLDLLVPIYNRYRKGHNCRLCGVHKSEILFTCGPSAFTEK